MKRLLIFLYFFVFASKAFAVVTIDITRGNLEPLPTAISNFYIDNPESFPETIKKLNPKTKTKQERKTKQRNLGTLMYMATA